MTVRFTPDIYRNGCPVDLAEECARVSVRYRDRGVVGLGIGGYEPGYPLAPYAKAVRIARDGGLAFVPHAGEAAGPESIREALDMGAHRLRHGIRAVDDPELLGRDRRSAASCSTWRRHRICAPASWPGSKTTRCRRCGRPVRCARSTPTIRRCSTPTSARTMQLAAELGVTSADAYTAGLAGALCDDATKARLASLV